MITILALVVTLGILITVHEFGHFWVARKAGVRVLRFSIGFGKPLIRWHDRQGTEFVIAAIPLGGYVKMLDEREASVEEKDLGQEFTRKPIHWRFAIVAAGPLANFAFAILVYWLMAMAGETGIRPLVDSIEPGSPAAEAGLFGAMEISSVDGEAVKTWQDVRMGLFERMGHSGTIQIGLEGGGSYSLTVDRWLSEVIERDPIMELGFVPVGSRIPAVIGSVQQDSAAGRAELQPGDEIVAINGNAVDQWQQLVSSIMESEGEVLSLSVERLGFIREVQVAPDWSDEGRWLLGITAQPPEIPDNIEVTVRKNPLAALLAGTEKTWDTVLLSFSMFGKMVSGLVSADNLGGPISIAKMAGQSAVSGLETFAAFLAFISISLGVVNLLPIPVLDGGHLLFYAIEWIRGKPLSAKVQDMSFRLGASTLMALMAFAIINDISRL